MSHSSAAELLRVPHDVYSLPAQLITGRISPSEAESDVGASYLYSLLFVCSLLFLDPIATQLGSGVVQGPFAAQVRHSCTFMTVWMSSFPQGQNSY